MTSPATEALASHTTESLLMTTAELVSRFNITADEVLITSNGVTLRGVSIETIAAITPALALTPSDFLDRGYEGHTFDGIPVTVEQSR